MDNFEPKSLEDLQNKLKEISSKIKVLLKKFEETREESE